MATHVRPLAARRGRILALALALPAAACSSADVSSVWAPFSSPTNVVASDSLTVQRVRGASPAVEPLTPEDGNVWPAAEGPRPTLLSGPDEAMSNIPEYRPSLIQGAPPASSPVQSQRSEPGPRGRRGTGGTPSEPLPLTEPPRSPVATPAPGATSPPSAPRTGQVLTDPSGRPAIGTGGAGRVQGFTQPGQGGGAVIRDGNVETWIGPDGQSRTRVAPN
jgi:hypothetical protein